MKSTVTLKGKIEKYSCSRRSANFVSPQADGPTGAVAAALAGESGIAVSLISASGNVSEEADYVEFSIAGQAVKGWLKQSVFSEGDHVEVVAERWTLDETGSGIQTTRRCEEFHRAGLQREPCNPSAFGLLNQPPDFFRWQREMADLHAQR